MKYLLTIPLLLIGLSFTSTTYAWEREHHLVRAGDRVPSIREEIVIQARKTGITPKEALAIAECESNFNQYAKNPNSTAKGIYQFISKTWTNYCEGDVLNYQDNIKCFVLNYKANKSWWGECL